MYLQAREDLNGWDGQSPPKGLMHAGTHPGQEIGASPPESHLPHFGPYERLRRKVCYSISIYDFTILFMNYLIGG